MAYGCVVLASSYRAIPGMLDDGRAGIFVEAGEPGTIVDAIEACSADPARYAELSRRALEHRRSHYTADAYLERMFAALSGSRETGLET